MSDTAVITAKLRRVKMGEKIARDPLAVADMLMSIYNDIEAMRCRGMDKRLEEKSGDVESAFGSFSCTFEGRDGEYVSWPNLEFHRVELAKFLDFVGKLTT